MARQRLASSFRQINRLVEALTASGWPVINRFNAADRPVDLDVAADDEVLPLRVFCWNVTPGGAHRAKDEYRVQTTRPGNVPLYRGQRVDLVLGYYGELDLFVAWDAALHPSPGGSSSLQVQLDHLEEAARRGYVARSRELGRGGDMEVVVAFTPEAICQYLRSHKAFRVGGSRGDAVAAAAAVDADTDIAIEELPGGAERQRVLRTVNRLARDARFRVRVLHAYGHRCALCGLGAGLAAAAHIHPVARGGADQVRNGVAACPTHHAALDLGLIVIADDLRLEINAPRIASLGISHRDSEALAASLLDQLRAPANAALRPSVDNLLAHRRQWS